MVGPMKTRFLLSFLAFCCGSAILVVSLFSATQVSSADGHTASQNKLYFSKNILPDHVFYKALMAVDRIQLETAPEHERIFIQVEYAHRRLDYAEQLLDENKEDLAVTTLTKAEQYLQHAVTEANALQVSQSVKDRLEKAVDYHTKKINELKMRLTDSNRSTIDQIVAEHAALIESLK